MAKCCAAATVVIALSLISTGCGPDSPESKKSFENVVLAPTNGVWVDPESHLTWATKDSGYPVTQTMAVEYCKNLRTANYKWELPTIEQLKTVYYLGENDFNHPVKGNIKLTGDWNGVRQ